MLERIEEIQGVGLLHQANGKPHSCKKATLIYADNGRGKSTLVSVLRSVSTGDASLIANRKTVDGTLPPKVVLQFDNGQKVKFETGNWSQQRPEVLVFDADFIERNVHSGSLVTTNHRKNLLEFALGEAAVAARTVVENATSQAKKLTEDVQVLSKQIEGHHTGMTQIVFAKLPQITDADAQISALQIRISAAGNVAAILSQPLPVAAIEPHLDIIGLFASLSTSLESVHADAEQFVKQHGAKLNKSGVEDWLSQGQQFDDGETCPYCAQDTANSNLIRAYQTHFNASYNDLKIKVSKLPEAVRAAIATTVIDRFAQSIEIANERAANWKLYVNVGEITFDDVDARSASTDIQSLLFDLCAKKLATPADVVGTAIQRDSAINLWTRVLAPMQIANKAIHAANTKISEYKAQLEVESIEQLRQQLLLLEASKRRHAPDVNTLLGQFSAAKKLLEEAESAKKSARQTLDQLMEKTLAAYQTAINSLLNKFGASFSIQGMGANFRGAAPRSEYGLLLRGKEVTLDGGSTSFATVLSEGDKRTLAFAFFVASTSVDPELAKRTVVIDDPMCSLDLNRKSHTRSVLKKLYVSAEQLIVLGHDPYFIRDLRDTISKATPALQPSLFQLVLASGGYTDFDNLDVDMMCESEYYKRHRLLNNFADGKGGDSLAVVGALRPMLEGYLHRRFPGLIPKALMFGEVIKQIQNAAAPSPLCHARNLISELNEINEYAGQFHHDANTSGNSRTIVATELVQYVRRALNVAYKGA